jgi:hypothetical protein
VLRPNVRFGSEADVAAASLEARFAPKSGHERPDLPYEKAVEETAKSAGKAL